ncbi:MAG: hypothetical protein Q4F72_05840 [Desulfovibrionaceae bacterium]|nr:hypothetical protein [Desulfovibrionaceae bacterium]
MSTFAGACGSLGRESAKKTYRLTGPGGADDFENDIWSGGRPLSDPVLVVSRAAPGVRYAGRMNGPEFHVLLRHAARMAGAENTLVYRNLSRRLMPGWRVWKEEFLDKGRRCSLDCLSFPKIRLFFGALCAPNLPVVDPQKLERLWPAFAGAMPEGNIYPIPSNVPWDLDSPHLPDTPLRCFVMDNFLLPVFERPGGGFWVPMRHLCRWFRLDYGMASWYLNEQRGEFGEKSWALAGLGGPRQLYVPVERVADCLGALAGFWRGRNVPAWMRAAFLANLIDAYVRCSGELSIDQEARVEQEVRLESAAIDAAEISARSGQSGQSGEVAQPARTSQSVRTERGQGAAGAAQASPEQQTQPRTGRQTQDRPQGQQNQPQNQIQTRPAEDTFTQGASGAASGRPLAGSAEQELREMVAELRGSLNAILANSDRPMRELEELRRRVEHLELAQRMHEARQTQPAQDVPAAGDTLSATARATRESAPLALPGPGMQGA